MINLSMESKLVGWVKFYTYIYTLYTKVEIAFQEWIVLPVAAAN